MNKVKEEIEEFEVKNADRIIRKKERLGKRRVLKAHEKRIKSQIGYYK